MQDLYDSCVLSENIYPSNCMNTKLKLSKENVCTNRTVMRIRITVNYPAWSNSYWFSTQDNTVKIYIC